MVVNHEAWIVALSVLVAIQGAYVGLNLALELPGSTGGRRRLLLAGAALTLAVAIWSMHFLGMLAVRSPIVRRSTSTTMPCQPWSPFWFVFSWSGLRCFWPPAPLPPIPFSVSPRP